MIAICYRVFQPAQHDHTRTRAKDRPLGTMIKGVTVAIG